MLFKVTDGLYQIRNKDIVPTEPQNAVTCYISRRRANCRTVSTRPLWAAAGAPVGRAVDAAGCLFPPRSPRRCHDVAGDLAPPSAGSATSRQLELRSIAPQFLSCIANSRKPMMGRHAVNALYLFAMVAVVVGVDVLFFRHHIWQRLIINVGIVLVFVAFYFKFLKRR